MSTPHLSEADRVSLDTEIRKAEQLSRAEISVFVGHAQGEPRSFATSLHNSLVAPARSILVMVDPTARAVEVVTGAWVRRHLDDATTQLAVATMVDSFTDGDLAGGLRRGIRMLAEHAREPKTLHAKD